MEGNIFDPLQDQPGQHAPQPMLVTPEVLAQFIENSQRQFAEELRANREEARRSAEQNQQALHAVTARIEQLQTENNMTERLSTGEGPAQTNPFIDTRPARSNNDEEDIYDDDELEEAAPARRKPLPWPKKFDGTRRKFNSFEAQMLHKLKRDTIFVGNAADKFYAIFENLEGDARKLAEPYYTTGGPNGAQNPDKFMEYLASHYKDQNTKKRAAQELLDVKQGPRQRFSPFFSEWERVLAEAGGTLWPDEAKLTILEGAINLRLQGALVSVEMPTDYHKWIKEALSVSGRIEGYHQRRNGLFPAHSQGSQNQPSKPPKKDKDGDTPMTGVNAAGAVPKRRAPWLSEAELARRKSAGLCFRCGDKDCFRAKKCGLLPAVKPDNQRQNSVRAVTVTEDDGLLIDLDIDDEEKE